MLLLDYKPKDKQILHRFLRARWKSTRTWASCHVDGFRCSLVAHRDVAGASRLALFISARLYGPLSPRPRKSVHPIKTMNDFG